MKEKYYPSLGETVRSDVLDNGLTVFTVPREGFSKVFAFYAVNYGGMDVRWKKGGRECSSPEGTAHFLEHKMFDMEEGSADLMLAANGAQANAFTSGDMTAYLFECTDRFEENLDILLNFVNTPFFTPQSVEKEMGIISQEIGMCEDDPYWRAGHSLVESMFGAHALKNRTVGTKESISHITDRVLTDCHSTFYVPSNMILCVVGDVDHDAVTEAAVRHTPRQRAEKAERWTGDAGVPFAMKETVSKMEISRPVFSIGFRADLPPGAPFLERGILGDTASAAVLGPSSELYGEMYADGIINGSFDFSFEMHEGAAYFEARGESDRPRETAERILEGMDRIKKNGIDPSIFSVIKKADMGGRIKELGSFEMTAWNICDLAFRGEDYLEFSSVYKDLTAEGAAGLLLDSVREENMVLSVVEPV